MHLSFSKYEGTGNDFIMIDHRVGCFSLLPAAIAFLCDRRRGIGADGLILLEPPAGTADFSMRYYNADGREGTMCGNGGRCITAFAHRLLDDGKNSWCFRAVDGLHFAEITAREGRHYTVRLKMQDVTAVQEWGDDCFLDTGSPHFVRFTDDVNAIDLLPQARAIRHNKALTSEGTNVNYVQQTADGLLVRTYERGVEDETLSCGTGAVAAAIAFHHRRGCVEESAPHCQTLQTRGGRLTVDFIYTPHRYKEIYLTGPAVPVFTGKIAIPPL